jgi:hypothetical protein
MALCKHSLSVHLLWACYSHCMHQETSQHLSHLSHLSVAAKNTKTLRNGLIALMYLENRVTNKIYDSQVH